MSIWTEFLQDKKFEIKDDYGIFLHKFKTPMFFSTERDLMTYLGDSDLKEVLFIKFKEDDNFKLFGSEKRHQDIINSTQKKKNIKSILWTIVVLVGILAYQKYFKNNEDPRDFKLWILLASIVPIINFGFEYFSYKKNNSENFDGFINNSIFIFWLNKSYKANLAYILPVILSICFGFKEILELGKSTKYNLINDWALLKSQVFLGEYYRIVSNLFVHSNMLHISAVAGALLFLSKLFLRFYNIYFLIFIFLITGIVGSFTSMILHPDDISYGASSSVLGILGFLISFILKFSNIIPKNFINEMLTSSILFIVFLGIVGFNYIDNTANLGGFVAGLLLGATLDNRNSVEAKIKESFLKIKI